MSFRLRDWAATLAFVKLIRAIATEPWMVERRTLATWLPLVHRLMNGEQVVMADPDEVRRPYASASTINGYWTGDIAAAQPGSVAIYPIHGPITKAGGLCHYGTEELMQAMRNAENAGNIVAHVLEIDSGGGQGSNLETVAYFIRNELKKPVVSWFNGIAASAAYYMGAAADEMYASQGTDQVGSIGVMCTFQDFREYFEKNGVKLHEVYAEQSTLKNQDFLQALEGDYGKLQEKMLNPYAARFIEVMQEMRPAMQEETAYQGEIFTATEAVKIGMIDGIITFQQAIDRAISLAGPQSTTMDNVSNIEAVLGYELNASQDEAGQEGVFLRTSELETINARITPEASGEQVAEKETSQVPAEVVSAERVTALETSLSAVKETLTEMDKTLKAQSALLDRIGGKPGAGPTTIATDKEEQPDAGDKEPSALDKMNSWAAS